MNFPVTQAPTTTQVNMEGQTAQKTRRGACGGGDGCNDGCGGGGCGVKYLQNSAKEIIKMNSPVTQAPTTTQVNMEGQTAQKTRRGACGGGDGCNDGCGGGGCGGCC
ncbi:hypothetical protein BpHYR1_028542 [Brachionus plicatilis]|uniref:Uncharacterized protein n=1 Tax=Brachionus plicatilis TaxID=10195 RepID=A0A3M7R421_BRAPC|nr:hypothetical protein BpHYR1_028542 [Brachionus plicatilis]